MLGEIMDAAIRRIRELFGDGFTIYTEPAEQGLKKPCFFILFLESSRKPMLGRRIFQKAGFCIRYIPEEAVNQSGREFTHTADILSEGMEYIRLTDGSLVRGTGGSFQIVDGGLNFLISYNMFLLAPEIPEEKMEMVRIGGGMTDETKKG